jgi:hypothetical protein
VQHVGGVMCGDIVMEQRSMWHGGWRPTTRGELRRGKRLMLEFNQGGKRVVGLLLGQPRPTDASRVGHCLAARWKIKEGEGWASLGEKLGFSPNG